MKINQERDPFSGQTVWLLSLPGAVLLNLFLMMLLPTLLSAPPDMKSAPLPMTVETVHLPPPETPHERRMEPKADTAELKTPSTQIAAPVIKTATPREVIPDAPQLPAVSFPEFTMPEIRIPVTDPAINLPDPSQPIAAADLDSPPVPVVQTPPFYPIRARRMGLEGRVTLRLTVDRNGTVVRVEVLSADPKGVFEANAVECAGTWRFRPLTLDGKPVMAVVEETVEFRL